MSPNWDTLLVFGSAAPAAPLHPDAGRPVDGSTRVLAFRDGDGRPFGFAAHFMECMVLLQGFQFLGQVLPFLACGENSSTVLEISYLHRENVKSQLKTTRLGIFEAKKVKKKFSRCTYWMAAPVPSTRLVHDRDLAAGVSRLRERTCRDSAWNRAWTISSSTPSSVLLLRPNCGCNSAARAGRRRIRHRGGRGANPRRTVTPPAPGRCEHVKSESPTTAADARIGLVDADKG